MCLVLPDAMNSYYYINLHLEPFYSFDLSIIIEYILWEEYATIFGSVLILLENKYTGSIKRCLGGCSLLACLPPVECSVNNYHSYLRTYFVYN